MCHRQPFITRPWKLARARIREDLVEPRIREESCFGDVSNRRAIDPILWPVQRTRLFGHMARDLGARRDCRFLSLGSLRGFESSCPWGCIGRARLWAASGLSGWEGSADGCWMQERSVPRYSLFVRERPLGRGAALFLAAGFVALLMNRALGLLIESPLLRAVLILGLAIGLVIVNRSRIRGLLDPPAYVAVLDDQVEIRHPALRYPLRIDRSEIRAMFVERTVRQRSFVRTTRLFENPAGFLFEHVNPPLLGMGFLQRENRGVTPSDTAIALLPVLSTGYELPTIALVFGQPHQIPLRNRRSLSFGSTRAIGKGGYSLGVMLAIEKPRDLAAALSEWGIQRPPMADDFEYLAGPPSASAADTAARKPPKAAWTRQPAWVKAWRTLLVLWAIPSFQVGIEDSEPVDRTHCLLDPDPDGRLHRRFPTATRSLQILDRTGRP